MKKAAVYFFLLFLFLRTLPCHAQLVDSTSTTIRYMNVDSTRLYVPVKAWRKLKSAVPAAGIICCFKSGPRDSVPHSFIDITYSYTTDTTTLSGVAIMDSTFTILKDIREIPVKDLPKTVTGYISKHFKHGVYSAGEGCAMTTENGKERYFIFIDLPDKQKYCDLIIDAKGTVLKKELRNHEHRLL